MKKNIKNIILLTFAVVMFTLAGLVAINSSKDIVKASAEESSTPVNLYAELLNATNTYNSTESEYSDTSVAISYGFTTNSTPLKNSNRVATSFANITVFTHGWTADDTSWGGENV